MPVITSLVLRVDQAVLLQLVLATTTSDKVVLIKRKDKGMDRKLLKLDNIQLQVLDSVWLCHEHSLPSYLILKDMCIAAAIPYSQP